jgi:glutaconyl-CoA/methylmalonyl-CoA decarboxylase subunit gamma
MIYRVKLDEKEFSVRIDDLHARPVIAYIGDECFEVWPTSEPAQGTEASKTSLPESSQSKDLIQNAVKVSGTPEGLNLGKHVRAPLPGVVISIAIQAGSEVEPGQELMVIEAMKMKNMIRAGRRGTVASVKVVPGQAVQYSDELIEFSD